MKKVLITLLLMPALALLAFSVKEPLPIGSEMPKTDVKMKDISGAEVTLKSAVKENGLLVMFSCNTCPVVKGYQSRINEMCKFAMEKDFGVILLNPNEGTRAKGDSYEDMKSYASKNEFGWYYTLDKNHELADAFGATRTPEVFLFDKSGKLVYHGAIDDNPGDVASVKEKYLKKAIKETLGGKDVANKKTKSVGCSIKRVS